MSTTCPWNFWVRDWREVHEVLRPFANVTNIHGHTHQVLYNELGKMRSIGMLATSWPWPYAPRGVPALTKCMVRADPGDHFDGVGWSQFTLTAANKVENEYIMWRKDVPAEAPTDSGRADNINQSAPAHRRPGMALLRRLQVSTRTSRREVNGMKTARIGLIAAGAILSLFMVSQAQAHKAKQHAGATQGLRGRVHGAGQDG